MPERDYVRAVPQRRKLKIVFRSKPTPPWTTIEEGVAKTVECSIPDVKPGTTWAEIKTYCKKFTWGQYYVTAELTNRRQMRCYGVSHAEAKAQILSWINLSSADIVRFYFGQTETEHPDPTRRKYPTLVYPAYAKLTKGDVREDGTLRSNSKETTRVDLWVDSEPLNASQLI